MKTFFAPAGRATQEDLRRQHESFMSYHCTGMVNSMPALVLVLNSKRQIVFANQSFLDLIAAPDIACVLGKRPGEALSCVHASTGPDGCGTSRFCSECGAVRAILISMQGQRDMEECHMLRQDGANLEALDLLVTAVPFELHGDAFTVFSVLDISHQNRRRALERIFFHDILNTAGGLRGLLEMLKEEVPPHLREDVGVLYVSLDRLVDEISGQRQIMAAEAGELAVRNAALKSTNILQDVCGIYHRHDVAREKRLELSGDAAETWLETDYTLLLRVLGNMVKNALEATEEKDTVVLGCDDGGDHVVFWVRNLSVMEDATRLNVFKRSFSTKGEGRGLGTYSMKMLGERYLGGEVSFTSHGDEGTVFRIRLPKRRPPRD